MSFRTLNKHNLVLLAIYCLAIYLRFFGVRPGYPPYHSDEGISYSSAVSMIKNGNLDPLRYDYPSLVPLINYLGFRIFFIPIYWFKFFILHFTQILDGFIHFPLTAEEKSRFFQIEILGEREIHALWWGRYITAAFGFGIVVSAYYLAKKLFSKRVALISTLLVSVNYRQVLNSHLGLPDIYNSFFLLLSIVFAHELFVKPTRRSYFLAGLFAGLSISTKYQTFSLAPLFFAHLYVSLGNSTLKGKIKALFSPKAFMLMSSALFIFAFLNPYAYLHIEQTIEWLSQVSGKYGVGSNKLDYYSFYYLFNIGIGKVTSVLVAVGLTLSSIKSKKAAILLLPVVLMFFYVTSYYTRGGFYTRNFVTITPILLVFAAFTLDQLLILKPKKVFIAFFLTLVSLSLYENLKLALPIPREYAKEWNFIELSNWESKNLEPGASIAAHSSVPLNVQDVERTSYEMNYSYSFNEFAEDGADYAITSIDWANNQFYWWTSNPLKQSLLDFRKPNEIMEDSYTSLSIEELSDFSVYSVFNPWNTPDSSFVVSIIPHISAANTKLIKAFSFDTNSDGWRILGNDFSTKNLYYENGKLVSKAEDIRGTRLRWESDPIDIDGLTGLQVEAKMQNFPIKEHGKEGFLFIKFFKSRADALLSQNRVGVRLSSRITEKNKIVTKKIISRVPESAHYATIGVQVSDPRLADIFLDEVSIFSADVDIESKRDYKTIKFDKNILFPYSHGNL